MALAANEVLERDESRNLTKGDSMHSMKHNLVTALVIGGFAIGPGSIAAAAGSADSRGGQETAARQGQAAATAPDRDVRADEVIGADVKNPEGRTLGKIEDLVIDVDSGRLRYAVLSHGGFMNVGDKLFTYPVEAFRLADRGRELVLNVPRERLENSPGFDKDRWPDFNDAEYRGQVDRYHGGSRAGGDERLRRVSEMLGADLKDRNGRDAGELKDLVFNLKEARVQYAVVDFDDTWRSGERASEVRSGSEPQAMARAPRTDRDTVTMERSPATSTTTGTADTTSSTGTPGTPPQEARTNDRQATTAGAPSADTRAGGDRLHAVPMSALQWSGQGDSGNVVLGMAPAQVRDQSGFDPDRLDNLNDPAFKRQMKQHMPGASEGSRR